MQNFVLNCAEAFLFLLKKILILLSPFLIGLTLAYLLDPLVCWLNNYLKNRSIALILTYLLTFAFLAAIIWGFLFLILGTLPHGGLEETILLVFSYFQDAFTASQNFLSTVFNESLSETVFSGFNAGSLLQRLQNWFAGHFSIQSLLDYADVITESLVSLFIGIVISVYLLKDKSFFVSLSERFFSLTMNQKTHGLLNETMCQIHKVLSTFVKGALIDSLIVGFFSSAVLTILNVKYSVIIGIIAGVLNIIPYFGPFFGMIPAFFVALFTGGFSLAVRAVLGLFIVQQIDSNYIYPKIVGNTIGLHPLFVLLSVTFFGYLFGIAGMLLAVPAAGILQIFVQNWAAKK